MSTTLSITPNKLIWSVLNGEPPVNALEALALLECALAALHELSLS